MSEPETRLRWALYGAVTGLSVAIFSLIGMILGIINLEMDPGVTFRNHFLYFSIAMVIVDVVAIVLSSISVSHVRHDLNPSRDISKARFRDLTHDRTKNFMYER
jgi:uncharacterized membrane protein